MVLAAAGCRHAKKSAVMEKQQNSTGFGGGEDSSDKFLPPRLPLLSQRLTELPADSTVRARGPRWKLSTQKLG